MMQKTLLDKLWESHEIVRRPGGASLLWVDRHLVHEGSHHAFGKIAERGLGVAEPGLTYGVADHYAPTRPGHSTAAIDRMVTTLAKNTARHGLRSFDLKDPRQGIVHVIGPELGLTLPGLLINCGDSHTSTHGAFGALAFGIGATEVAHVLATQTIWQQKPKTLQLTVDGEFGPGVGAKDLALHWIAELGSDGARGCAIEYTGSAVRAMSMEARMTLCNLSIEGGARFGMIAPDETTFAYIEGREYAPKGAELEKAKSDWAKLRSDAGAVHDQTIHINAADVAPLVTWGTSPEDALPITSNVPSLESVAESKSEHLIDALDYMGLRPGTPLTSIEIDQVFIGSCTNGRIEDLRAAAAVIGGQTARVPGMVAPGSKRVKDQAEQEGLDAVFMQAGLEWVSSGCSMCVAMNGDVVGPGKRCASTTNRNFQGRQGPGSRTHLMSPAMVAAAAITGRLTDVRQFLTGRNAA